MYSEKAINEHIKELEMATKKTMACTQRLKELIAQLDYLEGLRSDREVQNVSN